MDDFGETAATAGVLTPGATVTGEIETEGDIDWFAVSLVAGTTYAFSLFGANSGAGGGTLDDPVIEGLFDPNETALPGTFNDDFGGTQNSRITYTATVSGEYYLSARAFLGVTPDTGTYSISTDVLLPDLVATVTSLSNTGWMVNETLDIAIAAENLGEGTAADSVSYGVYLSEDGVIDTADQLLQSLSATQISASGSLQTLIQALALPVDQAVGSYVLGVIADSDSVVGEADEANNLSATFAIDVTPAPVMVRDAMGVILSVHATIADALGAAHDNDLIEVSQSYLATQETVSTGLDNIVLALSTGAAPLVHMLETGSTILTVLGPQGVQVMGNSEANLLTTGQDNDTLHGGMGNDTLIGLSGADVLDGGAGRDAVDYANSAQRVEVDLFAGTGDSGDATGDTLSSIEDVIGTLFNDLLLGGSEANVLRGGDGVDNVNGRGGNDLLLGEAGADLLSGGNDADTVAGGDGADRLFGNGGDDDITGGEGRDSLFGGVGADRLDSGSDNDSVLGQGSADEISGGAGDDILRGGSGNDLIEGGADNDALFGNGNNDTLMGGGGDDSIQGNAGSDRLFGDAGDDTLFSGIGGDRLDGGTGNDLLNGGTDDGVRDVFVFLIGYGADRINAFDQAGTDRIELDATLWQATNPGLNAQQAIDVFGTLNAAGTILTLDFGGGDILEVQNAAGLDQATLGVDVLIV